jgi:alpha 1,2-mannosyltransferase
MQDNGLKYGFTISIHEYRETILTLWEITQSFMREHPDLIPKDNMLAWVRNDEDGYNTCHFWSNFEIADSSLWRSERYLKYFEHLDNAGGFFYERWGDAPVHSLATAMFLRKEEVHQFHKWGTIIRMLCTALLMSHHGSAATATHPKAFV